MERYIYFGIHLEKKLFKQHTHVCAKSMKTLVNTRVVSLEIQQEPKCLRVNKKKGT